ncbi:unnamed protein product [Arctia plantaginis]|uniref:RCR-type E3 ubiquitin transferase n=1 Tax=Arctia plantaginis TaxID=874455 RepID=A0A8S1BKL7_ARCPL|nr:unnamed protein product [Arctia plantaginis]
MVRWSVSTERQFLSDFVAGAESTAGGRLARWLAPISRVEPAKCELKGPSQPVRPSCKLTLSILIRDQYGEAVSSPAMKVEVVVQRMESGIRQNSTSQGDSLQSKTPDVPYHPTVRDTMCFHAITMMKAYQNFSFEELRLASESWGDGGAIGGTFAHNGRIPAERLIVRSQPDGSYIATWTPRVSGSYICHCTLDDQPTLQELTVEVVENVLDGSSDRDRGVQTADTRPSTPPNKLRRFTSRYSAGLRIRASPSLQAEELGLVPPGASVDFVEEVVNKDGTWVRLGEESLREYTDCAEVAWCLQHHRHLDRALLIPIQNMTIPQSGTSNWSGYGDALGELQPWPQEDDDDVLTDITCIDDRRSKFPAEDYFDEADVTPFLYGAVEPSKRGRVIRSESVSSTSSPRRLQRRSNGNSDESWWSPVRHRSSENIRDVNTIQETEIETEPNHGIQRSSRLAQTGTQTSPDRHGDEMSAMELYFVAKEGMSPRGSSRDRPASRGRRRLNSPPPPLPARASPAPPPPRKHALSPSQAECLRAIFAALLWHEGIVHDAIACATFLKFHPQLPKQGTRVVTRPAHDATLARHQRHSVEVSNAGYYLRIHPSTLETLTRSGVEASTSRMRNTHIGMPIREEEAHCSDAGPSSSVVNVLPPSLRALVALWDALYEAEQLSAATDKKGEGSEKNENEDLRPNSGIRKKRDWSAKVGRTPYTVRCDLCGGSSVPPPLAAHMRHAHPGCGASTSKGFDRAGIYHTQNPPPSDVPVAVCGQLAQRCHLYYMFCEKCYDLAIKTASPVRQTRSKVITERTQFDREAITLDHQTMKENAVFLLDLAPLTNSEPLGNNGWHEASRSPPTPPGSVWQPAPPFQCLPALGAAPRTTAPSGATRYHSLGRNPPAPLSPIFVDTNIAESSQGPRVHRSVSMGQAGGNDLAQAARRPPAMNTPADHDTLSAAGSSLLAQPSASLRRLIGVGDWTSGAGAVSAFEAPQIDSEALMNSPVLSFILAKRDLHLHRQKMEATIRINTVRQYAFEALNWLLRSATQPTCVHDVMWWFCNALDKFARIVPPPLAIEDNKENTGNETARGVIPTASSTAICPGGRAARGARAAFHAFLGSVSALAPSLPSASAVALQAVRCWALHYSPHDRAFLHRSQVFSVISKILSHSEDGAFEDSILGALHESVHSYIHKENFVWNCPEVTAWCDITVSSRQGMAGALTDGSTETFWESGDEDRNKAKWIQVSYPGGTPEDRPHILCVHIDNTRDTVNKILLVSFLYSGGSSEMFHMQDIEVDPKTATWLCYTMPRVSSGSMRVRCELRGPEPAVRVRQVRVLGMPIAAPTSQAHLLHALAETDTLRVFRLLTSQVFGKLLEWERSGSESGGEGAAAADDTTAADDSDLREHVVGILFAGHKLTSLQRQVMSHIVSAIGCEAARVRDDWETALLCAEAAERDEIQTRTTTHTQDNYCFEMLSLLLALSGSAVGRVHLAQRTELLADLLALLHTGSERVQRQVISLLRRMVTEIPPQKMLAAVNYGNDLTSRVSLLDHLVCYLAKAISVQVKVKGTGAVSPNSVKLGGSVGSAPPATWFMRGETTKKHAHLVSKLLTDMSEDKISPVWGLETRKALAGYVAQVAQIKETDRQPTQCITAPAMWMALAALCICEQSYIELINGSEDERETRRRESEARPHCANHDDGSTIAVIECRSCGPLCAECDRFLHLNRSARTHHRQICKEEESAIRIDIHEGCGRAKLFWILLLVDRRTLKALAEFRGMDSGVCDRTGAHSSNVVLGRSRLAGVCRFCGTRGSSGLLAIGNVCADQQCQEHGKEACPRVLSCGHLCGGVRNERACLPCLHGCAVANDETAPLRQDADDMCMICFTDPLQAAPALQLKCGHVFHLHCCKKVLASKWNGPRITFSFSQCPICKEDMDHWTLEELLAPIRRLREEVKRKATMRLEYEGKPLPGGARAAQQPDQSAYAMERYAYYVCHKCGKAYFGGMARCEAETSGWWEPSELVCGACSDVAGARTCPKHGADFLEYKCRYCCSVAVFFCFGTSHFCNSCHDDFQRVTNIPKHLLPQCPAGPKGEQLPGSVDECPLHVLHPPTGEEFALGCGVCRNAHAF